MMSAAVRSDTSKLPWFSSKRASRSTSRFTWKCWKNMSCPEWLSNLKKVKHFLSTVHNPTHQKRHNSGATLTWTVSMIGTCIHHPVQTSIPWSSPYGPSWIVIAARPPIAAPPFWNKPFGRRGPASTKIPYGNLVYQRWRIWSLWSRARVVMMRSGGVVCLCICSGIYVSNRPSICWQLLETFKETDG